MWLQNWRTVLKTEVAPTRLIFLPWQALLMRQTCCFLSYASVSLGPLALNRAQRILPGYLVELLT